MPALRRRPHVINNLRMRAATVCSLAFSKKGTILASSHVESKIGLWRMSNKIFLRETDSHSDAMTGVVFVGDDGERLVSSNRDGTVRVYNWCIEELERECKYSRPVTCVAAFPVGERVAAKHQRQ